MSNDDAPVRHGLTDDALARHAQTNYALARHCQLATRISYVALLAVIAIDTLIAPSHGRAANGVVWLGLSLPLLIFAYGIWRGGLYSHAWLSFVSLVYFAQGVTALFVPGWRWLDVVYLLASIALFVGAMLSVRYIARARRAAA